MPRSLKSLQRASFDRGVSPFTAPPLVDHGGPPQQARALRRSASPRVRVHRPPRTFTMLVNSRTAHACVPPPLTRCLPSPMTSKIGQGAGGLCYKARREKGVGGRRRGRGGPLNCPSMSSVSTSPLYLSVSLFLPPPPSLATVLRQDRRRLTGGLAMREEKGTLEL